MFMIARVLQATTSTTFPRLAKRALMLMSSTYTHKRMLLYTSVSSSQLSSKNPRNTAVACTHPATMLVVSLSLLEKA
eukprot:11674217-Alexandrium_andersonii.AAC.1